MEPIALLTLSYKTVTAINAVQKIYDRYSATPKPKDTLRDLTRALKRIENLLEIQVYQPLKSGLAMLTDAEAEYSYNPTSAQDLAKLALESFNHAEGQLNDLENQLIAFVGKACAYKLLGKIGAYNSAATRANEIAEEIVSEKEIIAAKRKEDEYRADDKAFFEQMRRQDELDAMERSQQFWDSIR